MTGVVAHDALRLHVEDSGSGRPLVLIHPWCASTRVWDRLTRRLEKHRRVVRFDLRGFGQSEARAGTHTLDTGARDIDSVVRALGLERPTLVGWSLGVAITHRYLQLFGATDLHGVCLIDFPTRLDEPSTVGDKVCSSLKSKREAFLEAFAKRMWLDPGEDRHRPILEQMLKADPDVACQWYRAMANAERADPGPYDVSALLAIPPNGWFPEALDQWKRQVTRPQVVHLPKSRHAPPLEEPDLLAEALLRFTVST